MDVLVLLGSRNPEGQTAAAAKALVEGLTEAGSKVEEIFLPELTIERCRQCENDGWGLCRKEGRCTIEDDFVSVSDKIRKADAVVFATPVYFSDLSESIRAFLDRFRRINCFKGDKNEIRGKPALGICVAGGGGGGAPECADSLKRVLTTCGFDVRDMLPVRRQNLQSKLDVLRSTGKNLRI